MKLPRSLMEIHVGYVSWSGPAASFVIVNKERGVLLQLCGHTGKDLFRVRRDETPLWL